MKKSIFILFAVVTFFASCNNHQNESTFKKSYEFAQKAQDHATSAQILTQWLANDSTIGKWAYDSLALYHYFYAVNPSAVRNPSTAMFFVDRGLSLNNNNEYLKEIKGKLLLEQGKDTLSYNMFFELWKNTQNYTYYWDMAFIETARGKIAVVDSMIQQIMKAPDNMEKKVRLAHLEAQIQEEVPAKAAFLYLNSLLQNSRHDILGAAQSLQEALKISPKFYAAQRTIVELQRAEAQRNMQRR
jgi:hypothetical protein